jgi:lathosterol oxidase
MLQWLPQDFFSLLLSVFAAMASLTTASVACGYLAERAFPNRRVFSLPIPDGQLSHEFKGNLVFIAVSALSFTLALHLGLFNFAAPKTVASIVTFFTLMMAFQVFYYGLHRAMHHPKLIWMHRWHHRSQVTTPLSGQSVSVFEALGWMLGYVGLPALLSLYMPITFWGYFGYLAFNIVGNIVGHANVEPNSAAAGSRFATLFANPFVYHALHHARWTGHYAFQTAMMDRIWGTEFADWPALFKRIISGKPLASLKERGEAETPATP